MFQKISKKIRFSQNYQISETSKTFIVAEISGNHLGKIQNVFKSIDQIKKAGADAVKIQSYEPDTITVNSKNKNFFIKDKSIWKGQYLYDLYKKSYTPFSWHKRIFSYARSKKLLCFSSPFDLNSVKILEKNSCPIYKIASPEIQDLELIRSVAKTKKPIIISTGIADEFDIKNALNVCFKEKNFKVVLLNCISSYPAKNNELNISYINNLKKYSKLVGYSDHSNSDLASLLSLSYGAKVIEKHFILNKKIKSPDEKFSYDPTQFKNLVRQIRLSEIMLGKENINKKRIIKNRLKTVTRSFFYSKNIKKGEKISLENIKSVRPGTGLKLSYFNKIIGKKVKKNCKFGQPVKLKEIKI